MATTKPPLEDQRFSSKKHNLRITFSNHISFLPSQSTAFLDLRPNVRPQGNWRSTNIIPERPQSFDLPDHFINLSIGKGRLRIGEQYLNHSSLFIDERLQDLSVIRSNDLDSNGDPGNDYTIILAFAAGDTYFRLKEDPPKAKNPPLVQSQERNRFMENCFFMGEKRAETSRVPDQYQHNVPHSFQQDPRRVRVIDQCRLVRIIIPNYRNILPNTGLSMAKIKEIFDNKDTGLSMNHAAKFCHAQRKAVAAESEAETEVLSKATRSKGALRAFVISLSGLNNRFGLRFEPQSGQSFTAPDQSRLFLGPTDGGANPTAFFGQHAPTKVSGQMKGTDNCWQGMVFLRNRSTCCTIENHLSRAHIQALRALSDNKTPILNFEVTFDLDNDEGVVGRLNLATAALEKVMLKAMNMLPQGVVDDPAMKLRYIQSFANLFLKDHPDINVPDSPIQHDQAKLLSIFQDPKYQLQSHAQRAAIMAVFTGDKGRSIIRGPPATGKTTTVAKLVNVLLETAAFCKPNDGTHQSIVVGAHTNEAVRVCCARTIGLMEKLFEKSPDFIESSVCLVINDQMVNYWKVLGKDFDSRINNITLESHLLRHANQDRTKFSIFLKYRKQMNDTGIIEFDDNQEEKQYRDQRFLLINKVREKVKVWFGTLSSIHLRHEVFGIRGDTKVLGGVNTRVLIVDEASQATDAFVAMAILTTDPNNLVLAGDEKQLSPYAATEEGKRLWRHSLFERLQERSGRNGEGPPYATTTLLNVQYRTLSHLYSGTNAHYNNQVTTAPGIDNRPSAQKLLDAVKKIAYRDNNGTGPVVTLNNHVHVFNVQGTESSITETGSTINIPQWVTVRDFIFALVIAGVPLDVIMVLTPYQAQYDLMQADSQQLKGASIRKIDSSQGDEAGAVLFTMAKTNTEAFGFLDNMQRQNVASSRARDGGYYFVDLLMLLTHQRAQAWRVWHNGLKRGQPQGRTLDLQMNGIVIFRVENRAVNAHTAGSSVTNVISDSTRAPSPEPKSRPASPVGRSRSSTTTSRPRGGSTQGPTTPPTSALQSLTMTPIRPRGNSSQGGTSGQALTMSTSRPRGNSTQGATGSPSGGQPGSVPQARSRQGSVSSSTGRPQSIHSRHPSAGRPGSPGTALAQIASPTPGHVRKASGLSNSQNMTAMAAGARQTERDLIASQNALRDELKKADDKMKDYIGRNPQKRQAAIDYSNEVNNELTKRFRDGNRQQLGNKQGAVNVLGSETATNIGLYNWYKHLMAAKQDEIDAHKKQYNL